MSRYNISFETYDKNNKTINRQMKSSRDLIKNKNIYYRIGHKCVLIKIEPQKRVIIYLQYYDNKN